MTNNTRAEHALAALRAYVKLKRERLEGSSDEITDLIKDLLHLVMRDHDGMKDVMRVLRHAQTQFDEEHQNPSDEDE